MVVGTSAFSGLSIPLFLLPESLEFEGEEGMEQGLEGCEE